MYRNKRVSKAKTTKADYARNVMMDTYTTGLVNRQEWRIVVFRDGGGASRNAGATMATADRTGAGKIWSPEELDIENAQSTSLAVVVGEFLPQGFKGYEQDPSRPPHTSVLVRKLDYGRGSLFRLIKKGPDGICQLEMIPHGLDDRVYYYSEFVHDPTPAGFRLRIKLWQGRIREFCDNHPAVVRAHASPSAALTGRNESPPQAVARSNVASQNPVTMDSISTPRDLIHELIAGTEFFSMWHALEVTEICNKFWQSPEGEETVKLETTAIFDLARGLREGAMQGKLLRERYYYGFVVQFCFMHEPDLEPEDQEEAIRLAYKVAVNTISLGR